MGCSPTAGAETETRDVVPGTENLSDTEPVVGVDGAGEALVIWNKFLDSGSRGVFATTITPRD